MQTGILNIEALFSDTTKDYRIPPEPGVNEDVTVKLRTMQNDAECVCLVVNGVRIVMKQTLRNNCFDYFEAVIRTGRETVFYYFEIIKGDFVFFYNQAGAASEHRSEYDFRINPGFVIPSWLQGAVMYQILVDRFYNGDTSNDVRTREYRYLDRPVHFVEAWYEYPKKLDVGEFYGGDLQGVWDKLDYLQDLGIEVIYFNPLFVSPSNHKYDTQDYEHIDPHLGKIVEENGSLLSNEDLDNTNATLHINRVTNPVNLEKSDEFFAELIKEIHRRGMKVIIDGVFNHCGSFHKWMNRERIYGNLENGECGAFSDPFSPYRAYFKFDNESEKSAYESWWGNITLPKLNYENSLELEEYMLNIGKKWVSAPYYADGWRLDVAADLGHSRDYNHKFWKKFRDSVKQSNPDAVIIAEHYGDSYEWLQGDEWDTVMNYDAFMEPISWFFTGMEKHSDVFREDLYGNGKFFFDTMKKNIARLGGTSAMAAMNQLSNHDHSRFLTRTNHKVGRIDTTDQKEAEINVNKNVLREAVVVEMTWPGSPTVYYGDEAGICGWTDPDSRRTYPWGKEDTDLIRFHSEAIRLRKSRSVLKSGSLKEVFWDNHIISYGRFDKKDVIMVIVNDRQKTEEFRIPVWALGLSDGQSLEKIFESSCLWGSCHGTFYVVKEGCIRISVKGKTAVILEKRTEERMKGI